jgi:hypothetical protein
MNTVNHHRVIREFVKRLPRECIIGKQEIKLLNDASDYTDHFPGINDNGIPVIGTIQSLYEFASLPGFADKDEKPFFFYHFYYDIKLQKKEQENIGIINLVRNKKNDNNCEKTIKNCDIDKVIKASFDCKKTFFSDINNCSYWLNPTDDLDFSNQSACVSFLHAMGAAKTIQNKGGLSIIEKEKQKDSLNRFKHHLLSCFSEYLFIKSPKEALFILGIAFHGIMDSFTPSHMEFQYYPEQDMALHAQGDVVPFIGDSVFYEPGQYKDDNNASKGKTGWAALLSKHYNDNDNINDTEFEMFKIFAAIGVISKNTAIESIIEGETDISAITFVPINEFSVKEVSYQSLNRLQTLTNNTKYGDDAFVYSEAAIVVCKEIYVMLSKAKSKIKSFDDYKTQKETVIDKALSIWWNKYDYLKDKRKELFDRIKEVRKISPNDSKNPFAK